MRLTFFTFCFVVMQSAFIVAQIPAIKWGIAMNDDLSYHTVFNDVQLDFDNNMYNLGAYTGLIDFSLTSGQNQINCGTSLPSAVLTKRNPNGKTEWALPFSNAYSASFALTNDGGFVVLLRKTGTLNLNPFGTAVWNTGNSMILAKYRENGTLLWSKSTSVIGFNMSKSIVKVDNSNNIICSSRFTQTVDFDFSSATSSLYTPYLSVFVAKYDSNGNYLWAKKVGDSHGTSTAQSDVTALGSANNGDVVVCGWYSDTMIVDPTAVADTLIANPPFGAANNESFMVKLNGSGVIQYGNTFAQSQAGAIVDVLVDNLTIRLLTNFQAAVNLNPNPGTAFYGPAGGKILQFGSSGSTSTYGFYVLIGGNVRSFSKALNGNFYITGNFSGTTDFNPSASTYNLTASGGVSGFMSELNSSYGFVSAQKLDGSLTLFINKARRSNTGNFALSGHYYNGMDADFEAGVYTLSCPTTNCQREFNSYYGYSVPEMNVYGLNNAIVASGSTVTDLYNGTSLGDLCYGDTVIRTFKLKNTGTANLHFTNQLISGTHAANFTFLTTIPTLLEPDSSFLAKVQFIGNDLNLNTANVTFQNDDSDESNYNFSISGMVRPIPVVVAQTVSGNTVFCQNDSVTLFANGANMYTWNNGVNNNVQFTITNSTTYQVIGTSIYGCVDTANITLTVNPLPIVTISSSDSDNTICLGDGVTLTGQGASTYVFNNGVTNQVLFYPSSTTNYTTIGTDLNGCKNTASISIVVNALPTVSILSSDSDNQICIGDSITLQGQGANTYSFNNGVTNQTSFLPTSTNSYTVIGTDLNGCQNTSMISITVHALPTVTISSSDLNGEICLNDNITLTGQGANTYVFNNGVMDQVSFLPTTSATYSMVGTDLNGCQNSATYALIVHSLPTISILSTDTDNIICLGDSLALQGQGAISYLFNNGVVNQVYFSPTATTNYTITGTDGNGCVNTSAVNVVVNALPVISIISSDLDGQICVGDSLILAGNGATSYVFDSGVQDQVPFTPLATTTYTMSGTDVNNCMNSTTYSITVFASPTVSILPSEADSSLCLGDSISLNGQGATNYLFDNGVINSINFAPQITSTYTVIGTDGNGCIDTNTIEIIVNTLPIVFAGIDETVCEGDSVFIQASGASTYIWQNSYLDQSYVSFPPGINTLVVYGTDALACSNTDTVVITTLSGPPTTINYLPGQGVYTTNGAANYSWYECGMTNTLQTGVSNVYLPTVNGSYFAIVQGVNGCVSETDCYTVGDVGLTKVFISDLIVYPNPTRAKVEILTAFKVLEVKVYSLDGKEILKYLDSEIDLSSLLPGLYYLKIKTSVEEKTVKIEKLN